MRTQIEQEGSDSRSPQASGHNMARTHQKGGIHRTGSQNRPKATRTKTKVLPKKIGAVAGTSIKTVRGRESLWWLDPVFKLTGILTHTHVDFEFAEEIVFLKTHERHQFRSRGISLCP